MTLLKNVAFATLAYTVLIVGVTLPFVGVALVAKYFGLSLIGILLAMSLTAILVLGILTGITLTYGDSK